MVDQIPHIPSGSNPQQINRSLFLERPSTRKAPLLGRRADLQIIRLIIQTIRRDPSGSVWTDEAPDVSRPDRSGADQIDAEHQATDLAVGFESLVART
jgi:hypothetical protein